jgi:hypothetical protein
MPVQQVKTTKREPLFEDEDGNLFVQLSHAEGMRDLEAIREIVPAPDTEHGTTVRWLKPLGYLAGSKAEGEAFDRWLKNREAQAAAGVTNANGSSGANQSAPQSGGEKEPQSGEQPKAPAETKAKSAKAAKAEAAPKAEAAAK